MVPIILSILFIPVHPFKSVETTREVVEVYKGPALRLVVGPKVDKIVAICGCCKTSILKVCVLWVS